MNFSCCGKEPNWIENVQGKGYYFCQECRNEVLQPQAVEEKKFIDPFTKIRKNKLPLQKGSPIRAWGDLVTQSEEDNSTPGLEVLLEKEED